MTAISDLIGLRGLTYTQMTEYAEQLGVRVIEDPLPHGRHGACIAQLDRVIVDPRLTYRAKRVVLTHELVHWAHDDSGCQHETRTRLETARILINPMDYLLAERIYGPDTRMIASELAVTPRCVADWDTWAHDAMPTAASRISPVTAS